MTSPSIAYSPYEVRSSLYSNSHTITVTILGNSQRNYYPLALLIRLHHLYYCSCCPCNFVAVSGSSVHCSALVSHPPKSHPPVIEASPCAYRSFGLRPISTWDFFFGYYLCFEMTYLILLLMNHPDFLI